MKSSSGIPPFGDILNAGIQSVKHLCNRTNGITPKAFDKKVEEIAGITGEHLTISFVNPEFPIHADDKDEDKTKRMARNLDYLKEMEGCKNTPHIKLNDQGLPI